jgi:hypothetical protein
VQDKREEIGKMSYSELRSLKVTDISQLSAEELSILDENKRLNQQLQ